NTRDETHNNVAVTNGLFTVTLDFGNQFPGADRWLEIGVRTNGGGTPLRKPPSSQRPIRSRFWTRLPPPKKR
ncbi:MAG TPA: hypothetical protein PKW11_15155, partial [Pseudomonadota bacterium]|nr:hypothetical protein [Pseudomonadota bacterium]